MNRCKSLAIAGFVPFAFVVAAVAQYELAGAADLPSEDECELAGVEYTVTEPTFINDGEVTAATLFFSCEFKVPGTEAGAVRTVRDIKYIELDADQAQVLIDAAEDLLEDGYAPE